MGTPSSGKTSFCELLMAFVEGKRDPELAFDDSKPIKVYNLPEVISSNVFKVETVKPKKYTIHQEKE